MATRNKDLIRAIKLLKIANKVIKMSPMKGITGENEITNSYILAEQIDNLINKVEG